MNRPIFVIASMFIAIVVIYLVMNPQVTDSNGTQDYISQSKVDENVNNDPGKPGEPQPMSSQYNPLSEEEAWVILKKGTERPGKGEYTNNKQPGVYVCRQCLQALQFRRQIRLALWLAEFR